MAKKPKLGPGTNHPGTPRQGTHKQKLNDKNSSTTKANNRPANIYSDPPPCSYLPSCLPPSSQNHPGHKEGLEAARFSTGTATNLTGAGRDLAVMVGEEVTMAALLLVVRKARGGDEESRSD